MEEVTILLQLKLKPSYFDMGEKELLTHIVTTVGDGLGWMLKDVMAERLVDNVQS